MADRARPDFAALPDRPPAQEIPDPPDPALQRDTPSGPVPARSEDGRAAWTQYARPTMAGDPDDPSIAIVITDLGLRQDALDAALDALPPDVTLAFSPYSADLPAVLARARTAGNEALLAVPMEPRNFPASDPGPLGLLVSSGGSDGWRETLTRVLATGHGYIGVVASMGGRFLADPVALRTLVTTLDGHGLLYLDNRPGADLSDLAGPDLVPLLSPDVTIPRASFAEQVEALLTRTEAIARRRGHAVLMAPPTPQAFAALVRWIERLPGNDLRLVPLSAIAALVRTG